MNESMISKRGKSKILPVFLGIALFSGLISCTESDVEPENNAPVVAQAPSSLTLEEGFGTSTVNLSGVFTDADGDDLELTASSSSQNVVTVSISGTTLTVTEAGTGSSTITVTADDGNQGVASTTFTVTVNEAQSQNTLPTVENPISDMTFSAGFGSETVMLPEVFQDAETEMLMFSATSSNEAVVKVAVDKGDLTITEVGVGESTITVTASDEDGGSVSDDFIVTVESATSSCSNDNSIDETIGECSSTPTVANQYTETVSGSTRTITTNRVPNHDYGNQLTNMGITGLTSTTVTRSFTSTPAKANSTTSILQSDGHPRYSFGIAVNGVPIDPAPAEPFIFTNTSTNEYNWDWMFEPNTNMTTVGLDCNVAHLQPNQGDNTGLIHYHGDMKVFAESIYQGISSGTAPTSAVQIGWAADGFPIVYKYGPNASGSGVELLTSSYKLKSGSRPGDGVSEPCGEYNGKYTNDYEYSAGHGDLDECNGIQRSITLTTKAGSSETFSYFYVITDDFPVISRCITGTPDSDFSKANGG